MINRRRPRHRRGDRANCRRHPPHPGQAQRLLGEPGYLLRVITADLPAFPGGPGQPPRHPPRRPTPQLHPRYEECRQEPTIAPVPESVAPMGIGGVSEERCKWPNTLSCGLAGKGRYDRNTGGRESTIIEGSG
jgi:hypothetical protein